MSMLIRFPFGLGALYVATHDEEPSPLDWWKERGEWCLKWRRVEVIFTPRSAIRRCELRREGAQLRAV
jgi:hypothetical protein